MNGGVPRPGRPGASWFGNGRVRFEVWAPDHDRVAVHLLSPDDRIALLEPKAHGYHEAIVEGVSDGAHYLFRLPDGSELPDPASLSQPEGVHGPSQVLDPAFPWTDEGWRGLPLSAYTIYELQVGTFSMEGTFDGVIPHLDGLRDLGITAIEVMPVAQFPGERNWGYDGVYPYAAQSSYGGARGLQRLVDACHARGLAVILDVVHNHLGPEGNYTGAYGPYFTDRYHTAWGQGLNYDGPGSDEVRRFFIESALFWVTECHVDALRCDATDAIVDNAAYRYSAELTDRLHARAAGLGRQILVFAENDLNDPATVAPTHEFGLGYDAQWCDNYHHALHALLTGEETGYYGDFGRVADFAKAYEQGFVYTGQYSPYRQHSHGRPPVGVEPAQFVVCAQNHDQVGNRARGDRLSTLVPRDSLYLAAAATILSPFLPLIFMGEEYGETSPFQFFVDHPSEELREAVREGRRAEFAAFDWQGEVPDPNAVETFERSRLNRDRLAQPEQARLRAWYRHLLRLRQSIPAAAPSPWTRTTIEFDEESRLFAARRRTDLDQAILVLNFGDEARNMALPDGDFSVIATSEQDYRDTESGSHSAILEAVHREQAPVPALGALLLYRKETQ